MGQEILYCYKCQTRLLGSEFEKGKAFKVGGQAACPVCVKDLLGSVPDVGTESERGRKVPSNARMPVAGPDSSSKHRSVRTGAAAPAPAPEKSKNTLILGAVIGAVVVLILIAMATSNRSPGVARPSPEPVDPAPPLPPAPPPPKPDDPRPLPPATPFAAELRDIDERIRVGLANEEFRTTHEFLAAARKKYAAAEWLGEIDLRIPQVETRARRSALPLREKAVEAKKRKDDAGVKQLRDRIAAWGFPALVDEFDKALAEAAAPPPPPPPPPIPGSTEPPLVVYADGLAPGCRNLSWSSIVDLAATSPVFEGSRSVAFTPQKAAAGIFFSIDGGVDVAQYPLVTFAVYVAEDRVNFGVALYNDGKPSKPVGMEAHGGVPATREWKRYVVPVSQLNPDARKVTGFVLQVFKTGTQPLVYLDSVSFLKGAAVAAPPKPPDPHAARWAQAVLKASLRDYAGAQKELEESAGSEVAADLELVKLAATVAVDAARVVERWPKAHKVRLEFLNGAGEREAVEGTVLSADAVRVSVLRDNGPIDLPVADLHPSTIAEIFRGRGDRKATDAKAAAAFCFFEGDVESAKKHWGDAPLPEKLQAAKAKSEADAAARRSFWTAESEFLSPRRRAAAVEKFTAFLADASPVAARLRPYAAARLEAARDTVFLADDLAGAGTFQMAPGGRVESCWYSTAESAPAKAKENYVEAEFHAFPGAAYRAWIWAGGCCQETFEFSFQATELTGPNAKACEPGGDAAVTARLPLITLRKWHAQHGGPKEPAKWDWIPLLLPKYEAGGVKKLRVLSAQQGFSVGAIVVSATRRETPREPEIKELEKIRFGARRSAPVAPVGLILHEYWSAIDGDTVEFLTKHPSFAGKPSGWSFKDSFEGPRDLAEKYGSRMRGYIHPPVTGPYVFWIASDDGGELHLSPDDSPARKRVIAGQTMATGFREWTRYPTQKSAPVALTAGRRYYIEVLHKEGAVDDHLSVGWTLPDGTEEKPIPGSRLSPWGATGQLAGPPGAVFYKGFNANGPPTVIDGRKWEGKGSPALAFSTEGAFENQAVPLSPPVDDLKAAMIRSSAFSSSGTAIKVYQVPAGTYLVYLYLWEDNDNQVFDLFLNNREVVKGYNSGTGGHWDKLGPWTVTVADGIIEVKASAGGHANLSGLEIWKATK